jgi:hypothetical protein
LLSQHPHTIRSWFDDRKEYKSDFGLMEEIVCIFEFAQRFRPIDESDAQAAWKSSLKCSRLDAWRTRWGKRDRGSVCAMATPGTLRAAKAASGDGASRRRRSAGQSPAQT